MERHLHHSKADTHPLGPHRQRGCEGQCIIVYALTGKIMLGQPDIIEAQILGVTDLIYLLFDPQRILIWRRGKGQRQPTELHIYSP